MDTDPGNLIALMHHLRLLVSQMKPQGEMTFGEFCVMSMIEKETVVKGHKITPTSLNEMLGTKKPATSRMLTALEKRGFVIKKSDERDHRIYYLELSNKGISILFKERESFHHIFERIEKRLGNNEINQITKILLHLSNILEEEFEVVVH